MSARRVQYMTHGVGTAGTTRGGRRRDAWAHGLACAATLLAVGVIGIATLGPGGRPAAAELVDVDALVAEYEGARVSAPRSTARPVPVSIVGASLTNAGRGDTVSRRLSRPYRWVGVLGACAVLEDPATGAQSLCGIGESPEDGPTVVEVRRDGVLVEAPGPDGVPQRSLLARPTPPTPGPPAPGRRRS